MPCSNTAHPGHAPRRPQRTPPHDSHPLTSKTVASRGDPPLNQLVPCVHYAGFPAIRVAADEPPARRDRLTALSFGAPAGTSYRSGRRHVRGGWGREGARSELASGAATGPRGAAGPHNPEPDLARTAP